ncbi:hypothetical protein CI102_9390, partial [Trichoderma harzianum]
ATGMAETQLRCRIAVVPIWRCHKATAFGGVETQTLFQVLTSGRSNLLVKEELERNTRPTYIL